MAVEAAGMVDQDRIVRTAAVAAEDMATVTVVVVVAVVVTGVEENTGVVAETMEVAVMGVEATMVVETMAVAVDMAAVATGTVPVVAMTATGERTMS